MPKISQQTIRDINSGAGILANPCPKSQPGPGPVVMLQHGEHVSGGGRFREIIKGSAGVAQGSRHRNQVAGTGARASNPGPLLHGAMHLQAQSKRSGGGVPTRQFKTERLAGTSQPSREVFKPLLIQGRQGQRKGETFRVGTHGSEITGCCGERTPTQVIRAIVSGEMDAFNKSIHGKDKIPAGGYPLNRAVIPRPENQGSGFLPPGERQKVTPNQLELAHGLAGAGLSEPESAAQLVEDAVDELMALGAAEALGHFAYVHIGSSIDTAAQTYAQAKAGLLPATPVLVVGQPSVFDPSRAPGGKQTLWVQVRVVPAEIRGDAAGQIDATDWDAAKPAMTERVLDLIEAQAPGIRDRILGQHTVSPLDLEAQNPNLVGGDQLCGSHHMSQNFLFRPVRGFADGTTPVKGLHMIGAACWPGAGTGAGSGHFTAQALS